MTLLSFANKLLTIGTIMGQAILFLGVVYLVFFRKKSIVIAKFLRKKGLLLTFLIALTSTLASLFYSEIAGFAPCELCWFQRIFMYPVVILLGLALIKKDFSIIDYALSFSVIGFLISIYHNYVYYYNGGFATCQVLGDGVSCIKRYVFEFGYVTIPVMALTAFALVILFLLFSKLKNHEYYE